MNSKTTHPDDVRKAGRYLAIPFVSLSCQKPLAQRGDLRAYAGLHSTVHYGKVQARYALMNSTFLQFVRSAERKLHTKTSKEARVARGSNGT